MHCVTGFAPGLNWRPLDIVQPLPAHRVCGLCGVIARRAAVLPCTHVLCETCYEGAVACGSLCPLDGDTHDADSVERLDLQPAFILNLRVLCWNSGHGCDFAGPVSALLEHFENDCVHHRAPCPRCHQDVPRLHLVQHCADNCSPASGERRVEPTRPVLSDLEKACAEFRQSFAELRDQNYELQSSLNSVAQNMKLGHLPETTQRLLVALPDILKGDRVAPIVEMMPSSSTASAEIVGEVSRFSVRLSTAPFRPNETHGRVSTFHSGGIRKVRFRVADLKAVLKEHILFSKVFFTEGYKTFFKLKWDIAGDMFCLHVFLCIISGGVQNGTRWPFIKPFTVKIVRSQFEHADIYHKVHPDQCIKSEGEDWTMIRLCSLISLRTESLPDVHGFMKVKLQF
ncbi:uncharacterized protein ISCGN_023487 [Ixodes scapularis]